MTELGPLSIATLALLAERPMHPYEMYQLLIDRQEDRLLKVRPGTLYHAVGRLADGGLVRPLRTERQGNRPERTTYQITASGREQLSGRISVMLATPAQEYPEFPLAIAEAHNLPRDEVIRLLQHRVAVMEADLSAFESGVARADRENVPRRYWIDAGYITTMRRAEIDWLAGVLDELTSGSLPWSDEPNSTAQQHAGKHATNHERTRQVHDK